MTLRGDIRDYFEREANVIPAPAGLRQSVIAGAYRPDSLPHGTRLAAVIAAFVAVSLAAGLVAVGRYEHNLRPSLPITVPGPSAKPTNKPQPTDSKNVTVEIDFVDQSNGFALLCTIPGSGNCQYWVSRTTDAGGHWSNPVKVGPRVTGGDSGHHIHFADANDGLMYGNSTAYVTHDGGRTWRALNMNFLEIVSITGTSPMWMVMYPCNKGVVCPFEVLSSRDGARTWKLTFSVLTGFSPASVASFGRSGLLMSTFGTGDMLITRDAGSTWTPIAGQCPADSLDNAVATEDGNGIWQVCTPMPPPVVTTGAWSSSAHVSGDGGVSWHLAGPALPAGYSDQIAEFADGVVIYFATNTVGLLVSRDGGRNWTEVVNDQPTGYVSLSWLPDGEAWALDNIGTVWVTSDHGATWSKLSSQPPTG